MTLYINCFLGEGEVLLTGKDIIQSGEVDDIVAFVRDNNGNPVDSETVYFYEVFTPDINMSSDKSIIQVGERADLQAKVKDSDGSLVKNETVYFYVKED